MGDGANYEAGDQVVTGAKLKLAREAVAGYIGHDGATGKHILDGFWDNSSYVQCALAALSALPSRDDVIEEAAEVAETCEVTLGNHREDIVTAIRALKDKP